MFGDIIIGPMFISARKKNFYVLNVASETTNDRARSNVIRFWRRNTSTSISDEGCNFFECTENMTGLGRVINLLTQ
jgi:hypothetical protein